MTNYAELKAQNWLDTALFPFDSHYLETGNGKLHYVDQGNGDPILFVHGTPSWSFLYRELIQSLSSGYRCIAPDHLGFGLSDKPDTFSGTPEAHCENLILLIDSLQLENITLVVHDFGGPIGLGAAIQRPDKIKNIVVFNTWLWETKDDPAVKKIDRMLHSGFGKFLYLRMNFSPKYLLKQGFHNKKALTKRIHRQYLGPFPDRSSRLGPWKIGLGLSGSSSWYKTQWEALDTLSSKNWMIIWGIQDAFLDATYADRWRKRLPQASFHSIQAGHFLQEEKPDSCIQHLRTFLSIAESKQE